MNYVLQYWEEIEAGRIVVSEKVKYVYSNLVNAINNPIDDYIFSEARANKPIDFIERFCRHSKGRWAKKPVKLELFQKAYLSALFGFIHKETKLRKYRESLFVVARKNGKTTLLAGIALYMLLGDNEPGAEIYSTATKADQAKIVFDEIHNMVLQSPALQKHVKKRRSDLYSKTTMGKIQALSSKSNTLDGLNAHFVIMDELHEIKDRNLYEVMRQSQSSRDQPLLVMITTNGFRRDCIFDEMYKYAEDVINGKRDGENFLPIVYEIDEREEWKDPAAWPKANPGLGTIKKFDYLAGEVKKAQESPADLPGVLVKEFNRKETVAGSWLQWDELENTETYDIEQFRGRYAIGGVDLSGVLDLTCATLLMMDRTGKLYVHQMYWTPAAVLDKRDDEEKTAYKKWIDAGLMRVCEGEKIRYSDVTAWFEEMRRECGITPAWVYYDRYGSGYWVDEMKNHRYKRMVPIGQGFLTMSTPMKHLAADLRMKRINYNDNSVLKWCLSNTGVLYDATGNMKPNKINSAKMRIDGTAALLDAYVGYMEHYKEFCMLNDAVIETEAQQIETA